MLGPGLITTNLQNKSATYLFDNVTCLIQIMYVYNKKYNKMWKYIIVKYKYKIITLERM